MLYTLSVFLRVQASDKLLRIVQDGWLFKFILGVPAEPTGSLGAQLRYSLFQRVLLVILIPTNV